MAKHITSQQENMAKQIFSKNLSKAMRKASFTQTLLAEAAGCNQSAVSDYLKGRIPSGDKLVAIAKALHTTAEWLLTGEEDPRVEFAARLKGRMEGMKRTPAGFAELLKVPVGEVQKWLAGEIPAKEEYRGALRRLQFPIENFPASPGPGLAEVDALKGKLRAAQEALRRIAEIAQEAR